MASRMIGRTACPECGFHAAHVKESDKCVYRYCPECNSQHHAKSQRQRTDLLGKTRLLDPSPTGSEADKPATGSAPATTADATAGSPTTTTTTAPAPAKRRGLFA